MKVELTKPQIKALIGAGVEVQAGTGDGWPDNEWRALSRAITVLKTAKLESSTVTDEQPLAHRSLKDLAKGPEMSEFEKKYPW